MNKSKKNKKRSKEKDKKAKSNFFSDVAMELQRTEWISTKQVAKLSVFVLATTIILALIMFVLDIFFKRLIGLII